MRARRKWKIIVEYSVGWTLAFIFLSIVRGVGTIEMGSVQFVFWETLIMSLLIGPVFGAIAGYAQVLMEERMYKRMPMRRLLVIRLIYAMAFILLLILVSYLIVTLFMGVEVPLLTFIVEPGSFAIYFYILTVDFFMVFLRQVKLMLGDNTLTQLIQGKFYAPREEERIFMFLDLQSSTYHAEKLGHIKYSKMIQDCFNDLGIVLEHEAEIVQYVGDEALLTWKVQEGVRNQHCIKAYFSFKQQLLDRKDHYLERYGIEPKFKAGLNSGLVTVTEVGKYKKEIAYHGDAINTASRIQGQCNEFQQELLISEHLMQKLDSAEYKFQEMGTILLRGKEKEISVYSTSEYPPLAKHSA